MNKKVLTLITIISTIFIIPKVQSQTPNSSWGRSVGSSGNDWGAYSVTDKNGNTYVTGYFSSPITIGSQTYSTTTGSGTETDIFICKYDQLGNVEWAKIFGGNGNDESRAIALDTNNNVCIAGRFVNTANFDGQQLTSASPHNDGFIAVFNSTGTLLMLHQSGVTGNSSDHATYFALHVTKNNELLAGGSMHGTIASQSNTSGTSRAFLVNVNIQSGLINTAKIYNFNNSSVTTISTDTLGNVFWGIRASSAAGTCYLYKGPNIGSFQYNHPINNSGADELFQILPNNNGGCVAIGIYDGNYFINEYDQYLSALYSYPSSSSINTLELLLPSNSPDYFYLVGTYGNLNSINSGCSQSIPAPSGIGSKDIYIQKRNYNLSLGCDSAFVFGVKANFGEVRGLGVDENNNVYVSGYFTGNVAGSYLTSKGSTDIYTIKFGDNLIPTGLNNQSNNTVIYIHPNPANNFLKINNLSIGSTLNITDITGEVVYSSKTNNDEITINTSELSNGVYILQVTNNGTIVYRKFVINK
ncbi:MAG: T9SS type A sorting domain-containing protein [Bacteroidia bacterium]|nr:T9SS type A sorting domain-containing protein [Bacteroidia bacterium]